MLSKNLTFSGLFLVENISVQAPPVSASWKTSSDHFSFRIESVDSALGETAKSFSDAVQNTTVCVIQKQRLVDEGLSSGLADWCQKWQNEAEILGEEAFGWLVSGACSLCDLWSWCMETIEKEMFGKGKRAHSTFLGEKIKTRTIRQWCFSWIHTLGQFLCSLWPSMHLPLELYLHDNLWLRALQSNNTLHVFSYLLLKSDNF